MNGYKINNIFKIKVFFTFILGVAVIISSLVYFKKSSNVSNITNGKFLFKKDYNFVFVLNEPFKDSIDDKDRDYLKDYNGSIINSIIIMSIKTDDKKINIYRLPQTVQCYSEEVDHSDEIKYYYCNNKDEKNLNLFIENIIKSNVDSIYKINTNNLKNLKQLSLNLETNDEENVWTINDKKYIVSKNDYKNVSKEQVESIVTRVIDNYSKLRKNQRYNLITSIIYSSYNDVSLKKIYDALNIICDNSNLNTYKIVLENMEFQSKSLGEIVKNVENKYKDIQLVYYGEKFDIGKNYFVNLLNKEIKKEEKETETENNTKTNTVQNSENTSSLEKKTTTTEQSNTITENRKRSTKKKTTTNNTQNTTQEGQTKSSNSSTSNPLNVSNSNTGTTSVNDAEEKKADEPQNTETKPVENTTQEGTQEGSQESSQQP